MLYAIGIVAYFVGIYYVGKFLSLAGSGDHDQ
jgi:hypothetical protein